MDKILNKITLIKDLADSMDLPQTTIKKILDQFLDMITQQLKLGGQVSIAGFGNFITKVRPARIGRNPKTGEQLQIEEARIPMFKPSKALKDFIKEAIKK